jgi:2-C-methyl-D-erythritol 2,4-cyclodiphosphate synthase
MRIGLGYDIHRLEPGRAMMIGGVKLPYESGPMGHSDGDALLHALCDAMLGAAGLGDIGEHFPDTDPRHKDAASSKFVQAVLKMVTEKGFRIGNVDADVYLEKPKLGPKKMDIRRNIAELLGVPVERVSVKARTMEGLGPIGESRAYAAQVGLILLEAHDHPSA